MVIVVWVNTVVALILLYPNLHLWFRMLVGLHIFSFSAQPASITPSFIHTDDKKFQMSIVPFHYLWDWICNKC